MFSIIDNCITDCYNRYFHPIDHICVYGFIFTNITNIETVNFTIFDKNMCLFEFKKIKTARENGFIFNHKINFKIKIFSNLSNKKIHCYLKLRIPILHQKTFRYKFSKS